MQKKEDWSVAFLCLFLFMSVYGIQRTSSVYFVEISQAFSITKEAASVPFTTLFFLENILGPVAGCLGTRYDLSAITILGCFLEACGFALNFVAQDIITITLFYGVVQGIGQGLVASLIPPILNNNFDKYFSTACGIALSGNSVGGIVLPILSKALIETYTISGAFLIIGGLILNTIPVMLIIRYKASRKNRFDNNQPPSSISGCKLNTNQEDQSFQSDNVILNIISEHHKNEKTPTKTSKKESIDYVEPQLYASTRIKTEKVNNVYSPFKNDKKHPITLINARKLHDFFELQPYPCSQIVNIIENGDRTTTLDKNYVLHQCKDSKQNVSRWYPFRVFLDVTFLAMMLLQGSLYGVLGFLNTILVDLFLEKNILVRNGTYILAGVSAAYIVGCIGIGRFSDSGIISVVNIAILCLISMMCSYISLIWCTGIVACLLLSLVHGIAAGGLDVITTVVVKKYSMKEFKNMALASKNILTLPFIVVIPSVIGFFKDRNGSYNGVMFILSGICLVCIFVTYSIPYLARRRDAKKI